MFLDCLPSGIAMLHGGLLCFAIEGLCSIMAELYCMGEGLCCMVVGSESMVEGLWHLV